MTKSTVVRRVLGTLILLMTIGLTTCQSMVAAQSVESAAAATRWHGR